jgi:outer membrane biosynthesis protein TonB
MPYGIMRFAGPSDMEQAPRPRTLPDQAPLLAALDQHPEAEALLRFTVTTRGKPRKIEVVNTNDQSFARLAKTFVEKIKFRPARANGRSVACEVEMPFALN